MTQPLALPLQPPLELRSAAHEETIQQVTPIERQRLHHPAGIERRFELDRVTVDYVQAQADFIVPTRSDGTLPERIAQDVQGLVQRASGMVFVRFGPEEGEKLVSSVKATRDRGGEIGEKSGPLGLPADRIHVTSGGGADLEGTENPKLNHGCS
jgi:hypothetical protein